MCGVAVAVVAPCVVLQSRSLHCVWCYGHYLCAAWVLRSWSLHHVVLWSWWLSLCRSHCRHIVTGPQKRKLVEKRKKETYQQADAVCAATRGTAMQCVRVQGHGKVGACQHCHGREWGLVGP